MFQKLDFDQVQFTVEATNWARRAQLVLKAYTKKPTMIPHRICHIKFLPPELQAQYKMNNISIWFQSIRHQKFTTITPAD